MFRTTIHLFAAVTAIFMLGSAEAADYYVSAAGDDDDKGRDVGEPLRTPERAFDLLRNGDSVFFRAGDRFVLSEPLRLGSSGSADDPIVIGAYRVESDGSVTYNVEQDRPVLDGDKKVPERGTYVGLIHVTGDHVEIRDLELRNSGGMGIRLQEMGHASIRNVATEWSYFSALQAFKSDHIEIVGCDLTGFGQGGRQYGEPVYPAGISLRTGTDVRVADCVVHEGWGEGINSFYGSSDVVIEHNTVFAVRNVGLYIDSTNNIDVRNNIVLGTSNAAFHRYSDRPFVGPGIALNNEMYQFEDKGGDLPTSSTAKNIRIYNNLVAGTVYGLAFWGRHPATNWKNVVIAHNTFVDNYAQIHVQGKKYTNVEIANNIFLSAARSSRDYDNKVQSAGITWRSNYWSEGKPPGHVASPSDIYEGIVLQKMSGWQSLRSYDEVTWKDFRPMLESKTNGAGIESLKSIVSEDFTGKVWDSPPDIGALGALGALFNELAGEPAKPLPPTSEPRVPQSPADLQYAPGS